VTLSRVRVAGVIAQARGHQFCFFFGSIQLDADSVSFDLYLVLLLYLVFRSYFLCSPTFALSIFDFCMSGVFTEWEYWKSAQLRARVCPMAERPMWPCHSVYRETAGVERTISLLDFLTAPATISNN